MTSKRLHKIKQLANSEYHNIQQSLIRDKDKTTDEDSNFEGVSDDADDDDDDVVLLEVGESSNDESDDESGAILVLQLQKYTAVNNILDPGCFVQE